MTMTQAPFIAISRHRIQTDGEGVTTLCGFYGCPLRCKYCINPQSFRDNTKKILHTPESLYNAVKLDDIYFLAIDGYSAVTGSVRDRFATACTASNSLDVRNRIL